MGCVPLQLPVDAVSVWPCNADPVIVGGDVFAGEEACLPASEPPEPQPPPEPFLTEELRSCVEWWRRTHRRLPRRCARWVEVRVRRAEARQWWRARWCFAWECDCASTA